jgi:hypothetical protein
MEHMKYFLIQFAEKVLTPGAGKDEINNISTLSGDEILQNGLNIVYFAAGAAAIIVIIIGGIMYATSSGDASGITKAKNQIVYAVVGLVIVLAAFAITNLVIGGLS